MNIVAAALAALTLLPAPAVSGSVGWTHALAQGQVVAIDNLAACTTGGMSAASTTGAGGIGFVTYGPGKSTCGSDTVTVTGRRFRLDGLTPQGGPVITIGSFSASCSTTPGGSRSVISVTGLSGIEVPNPIPANYTVTMPMVAKIVVNEVITPDPPDGSMTVNLLHVTVFDSGEVVVGSVSCSPGMDGNPRRP